MNLAPRERRTVLIGAVVVALVAVWLGVKYVGKAVAGARPSGGDYKRAHFVDSSARIKRHAVVSKDLKQQTETLKIEVPNDPPEDQMKKLVERFEQLAGRSNVQIRNITQLKAQTRTTAARAASPRTDLKLDLTAQTYAGLVRFVDSLEQATVPIVVDQISVTAMGGRTAGSSSGRSGRGGEPQKRQLQAALKVYTYLFPEKAQQ